VVADAPHNAIDINTPDRIYTIASDTQEEMVRWAKVLKATITDDYSEKDGASDVTGGGSVRSAAPAAVDEASGVQREAEGAGADAGEEFDVVFETKESLFMSLEGLSTYTIVVTGFVKRPDGSQGQAESSGKIKEDDYLIGVNNVNLEDKTFFDSIGEIQQAVWPMTLKFRRTKESEGIAVRNKGWCLMKEPDNTKFFRRFLQLHDNDLSYFKPAYGGRQADRHGFINAGAITCIAPKIDQRAAEKLQFQITLTVDGGDWIMCVRDEAEQDKWCEVLGKRDDFSNAGADCEVKAKETVEASQDEILQGAQHSGALKKQSDLDASAYNERFFILKGAELTYQKTAAPSSRTLGKVDLNNVQSCTPMKISNASAGLEHRIKIVSKHADDEEEKVLMLATGDEASIAVWKEKFATCFTTLGSADVMQELVTTEEEGAAEVAAEDDDVNAADVEETDGEEKVKPTNFFANPLTKTQGWMYKKGDTSNIIDSKVLGVHAMGVRNSAYRKRFFVLQQAELCYYKTRAQSLEGTPTGVIPLRRVTEVKWSQTTWAENGIDLVTARRQFTVVPESEEEASMWFDALVEAVDMVQDTADDSGLPPDEDAAREKLQGEIKASLSKAGALSKLTGNRLTGLTSWKTRFFALSGSVLSYYEKEGDLYNEDMDALGTVNMQTISSIKSSNHPEVEWKRAFELKVGERTYVLQADTAEDAVEWMISIAASTGKLEVEQASDGTWVSKNPKAQLNKRLSTYGAGAKKRATRGRRSVAKKRTSMTPMDITAAPVANQE
jgi:hypothetical protein